MKSKFAHLPGYDDAVKFRKEFVPVEGADYEWVERYAQDRYRQLSADFDYHDAKAGFVITFIGGGFGVLTVGSLAMPMAIPAWVVGSLIVPIVFALISLRYAIQSRRAFDQPACPSVELAADHVSEHGPKGRAIFLGQLHWCCEMLKAVNDKKAALSCSAGRFAFWSIALLAVPFALGVVWRASDKPASPQPPLHVIVENAAGQ